MDIYLQACLISILLITLALACSAVRFPSEHVRLVVFRLGRFVDVRGPGWVFLIPFVERAVEVDLREQECGLSWQGATRDRMQVKVELLWRYQVVDPAASILEVADLEASIEGLVGTILRRMILDMERVDLRMNRRSIEMELKKEVREGIRDFGAELKRVEIKEITVL